MNVCIRDRTMRHLVLGLSEKYTFSIVNSILKETTFFNHETSQHHAIQEIMGAPYNYHQSPDQVPYYLKGQTEVNCVYVVHYLLERLFTYKLPPTLDPVHMILPNPYVRPLLVDEPLQLGDIFFFAQANIKEFRAIPNEIRGNDALERAFKLQYPGPHLALFLQYDEHKEPLLIHGNYVDKKVSIWPYTKFSQYKRYEVEYARKRPVIWTIE